MNKLAKMAKRSPVISSNFDSGNIQVISLHEEKENFKAFLKIKHEPFTEGTDKKRHAMWFHFKASNVLDLRCKFHVVNASECSYANAWRGYRACCSVDRKTWFRVPTEYDEKELTISVTPSRNSLWVAYFEPFSYEQHQDMIGRCISAKNCLVSTLGQTLDGRDLDLVECGTGPLHAWIIARQHPGESMAEHWMEGFLTRLLDPSEILASLLKTKLTFHVIPNMNPDGAIRGHLRTNAVGANLNREWASTGDYLAPTLERSPEVFHVLKAMDETGCDFFLDVHGDEELPHNFLAGAQGVKNWSPRLAKLHQDLCEAYRAANSDFGDLAYNYSNDEAGKANLAIASDQICHRFDCLSATLEQPFKDCFAFPEPLFGYSRKRCLRLGASMLDCLDKVVGRLRTKFEVDEESIKPWVHPGYKCPKHEEPTWKGGLEESDSFPPSFKDK